MTLIYSMTRPALFCLLLIGSYCSCDALVGPPANSASPNNDVVRIPAPDSTDWDAYGIRTIPPGQAYAGIRSEIQRERTLLHKAVQRQTMDYDSVGLIFTELLVNQIIPYWYGTPWSFEGHTEVPGQGKIACGYFVSTTLQHAGIRLNRYRLAQQAPQAEAKAIAMGDSVTVRKGDWLKEVLPDLQKTLKEGIYFIGLGESHVGFLLQRKGRLFFLHSNYTYPAEVRIEPANGQSVLNGFSTFHLTPVSGSRKLMEAWLRGREVAVLRQ